MVNYLIDNCYVTCGDSLFRQKIGIPMGTDCAPFLANLFLFSYENEWMMRMKQTDPHLARQFCSIHRWLTINNDGLMKKHMNEIYPEELELKHENSECDKSASYLDLQLDVMNDEIVTSLYDKRDDFLTSRETSQGMDHMVYSLHRHSDMPRHVPNAHTSWIAHSRSNSNSCNNNSNPRW